MYGDKHIRIGKILVQISAYIDLHLLYEIKILKKSWLHCYNEEGRKQQRADCRVLCKFVFLET